MADKKDYPNVTICGAWECEGGHVSTMPLGQKEMDALSKCAEVGGKIFIRRVRDNTYEENKQRNSKTPRYYLEFVPAAEVEKFNNRPRQQNKGL